MKWSKEKILVFEDRDVDFDGVRNALQTAGYKVVRAKNPEEFLQHGPYAEFAVVLIDLFLGSGTAREKVGINLTAEVKRANPNVPIVVVSARKPGRNVVADIFRAGAVDYADKQDLRDNLQTIIERARATAADSEEIRIEQEMPLPIAYLFRDFVRSRTTAKSSLERLVELFEVILKMVAYSLMSAHRSELSQLLPPDLRAAFARPSLGHIMQIIIALRDTEGFLEPLAQASRRPQFRDICQRLIRLRNEHIGHGILQSPAVYEALLSEHKGQMLELLSILTCLRQWRLVWPNSATFENSDIEYEVKIFQGSYPDPALDRLKTNLELRPAKHVYLIDSENNHSIDLYPWCQFLVCEQRCLREKLFLYRMAREGEVWALDHIYGHALQTREGWPEVRQLIDTTCP